MRSRTRSWFAGASAAADAPAYRTPLRSSRVAVEPVCTNGTPRGACVAVTHSQVVTYDDQVHAAMVNAGRIGEGCGMEFCACALVGCIVRCFKGGRRRAQVAQSAPRRITLLLGEFEGQLPWVRGRDVGRPTRAFLRICAPDLEVQFLPASSRNPPPRTPGRFSPALAACAARACLAAVTSCVHVDEDVGFRQPVRRFWCLDPNERWQQLAHAVTWSRNMLRMPSVAADQHFYLRSGAYSSSAHRRVWISTHVAAAASTSPTAPKQRRSHPGVQQRLGLLGWLAHKRGKRLLSPCCGRSAS